MTMIMTKQAQEGKQTTFGDSNRRQKKAAKLLVEESCRQRKVFPSPIPDPLQWNIPSQVSLSTVETSGSLKLLLFPFSLFILISTSLLLTPVPPLRQRHRPFSINHMTRQLSGSCRPFVEVRCPSVPLSLRHRRYEPTKAAGSEEASSTSLRCSTRAE